MKTVKTLFVAVVIAYIFICIWIIHDQAKAISLLLAESQYTAYEHACRSDTTPDTNAASAVCEENNIISCKNAQF